MVGVWVICTCWSTSGSRRETTSVPPQSGQPSRVWGWKWLTSSGGNGDRKCCSCPGCPPRLRFLHPLGSGFFGLTRSLDGGLEEFDEFFLALASSPPHAPLRSRRGAGGLGLPAPPPPPHPSRPAVGGLGPQPPKSSPQLPSA